MEFESKMKIELVFLYKPFDFNTHYYEIQNISLNSRESNIASEFELKRIDLERIKIYILTPSQLIDNLALVTAFIASEGVDKSFAFFVVDEISNPITIKQRKKLIDSKDQLNILADIQFPYTQRQILEELKNAVYHVYLHNSRGKVDAFLKLRDQESRAINDISRAIVSENDPSAENLVHLILRKSVEISQSDAGFMILRSDIFDTPEKKSENQFRYKRIRCYFEEKVKILYSQNISLKHDFLDPEQSRLSHFLVNHGIGVSWFEGDDNAIVRGKDEFYPKHIPEFIFDHRTYKIKSYCAFPVRRPDGVVEGFIILFNKRANRDQPLESIPLINRYVVEYSAHDLNLLESFANQAGISLEHAHLISDLRMAFEAFTSASIVAIESRDPSTKGHSERVAILTVGLAEALNKTDSGIYGTMQFSKRQIEEIRIASLLHDFGKIGVREHVLQKEKKFFPHQLERIQSRFDGLKDKLYIHILESYINRMIAKKELPNTESLEKYKQEVYKVSDQLEEYWSSILVLNEPSVENNIKLIEKFGQIAGTQILVGENHHPILMPEEIDILNIGRGSLSAAERIEIESHVVHSYNFLAQLPWSNEFKDVPEIVYGHHERLDGSGYPRQLTSKEIPLQAKMMAITDVFDALVAKDRPYKKAIPYERALAILEEDVRVGKLDGDLFKIFVEARVGDLIKQATTEIEFGQEKAA